MMITMPKPSRPPPVIPPSSVWVKPYSAPQMVRTPARTEKPTPDAKMAKKPAHKSRCAFEAVPLDIVGSFGVVEDSGARVERVKQRTRRVNHPADSAPPQAGQSPRRA